MAKLYAERDERFLGPVFLTLPSENIEEFNDEKKRKKKHTERKLISIGYNRVVKNWKKYEFSFKSNRTRRKKRLRMNFMTSYL